jgi:hypothetical protein
MDDDPAAWRFADAIRKSRDSVAPADLLSALSHISGSGMEPWFGRNRETIILALQVLDCWRSYMDGGFLNDDEFLGEVLAHFAEAGGRIAPT